MKKLSYLIVLTLILGLVLSGCLLSNIGQAPATEQSGITYLTKGSSSGLVVGLWHFDDDALDSSGNGNNGTLKPTGSGPTWVNGKFGKALSFDGVDDYVDCGTNINITTAITIEAWVKPSAFLTTPDRSTIATKALAYYFQVDGSGYLQVYQYGTSPAGYHSSTNPISLDVWQHVAYTYDGSNVKMFINGVLDTTIPVTGIINASTMHLGIGMNLNAIGNPYFGYYRQFQGEIDEVRIWNIALTANQIQQSMVSPLPVIVTTNRSEPDSVAVNTEQDWDIAITVCNYDALNNPTDVVVQDGMGADLDEISEVGDAPGIVVIAPKTVGQGNQKMRATMVTWTLDLGAGSCEALVVNATTGFNPKGYHEFTTVEEDHELDGGASATYWYEGIEYETPETEPLTVDVIP
jgi:hypothetical protein